MKVWVSAEMEADIANDFRLANNDLEDQLAPCLDTKKYDLDLNSLDCIAIIRNDNEFDEIHKYSKKNKEMDFRLSINYQEFKSASFSKRKSLILGMLVRAVDILSEKNDINKTEALKLKKDLLVFGNEFKYTTT